MSRRAPIQQPPSALAGLLTVTAALLVKKGQMRIWRMCLMCSDPPSSGQQQTPSWVTEGVATGLAADAVVVEVQGEGGAAVRAAAATVCCSHQQQPFETASNQCYL